MYKHSLMRLIADAAIKSVAPNALILSKVKYVPATRMLLVNNQEIQLKKNVILIGFGKAVLGMAEEVYKLLGQHIVKGVVSVPFGSRETLEKHHSPLLETDKIRIFEGAANNLPDESSHYAAQQILQVCCSSTADDTVLALVSGGGSALLPIPMDGITLQEKIEAISVLSKAGATIQELNVIRQAISKVKGGRLAHYCLPSQVISLILSDVIGDPIDLIASGATVCMPQSETRLLQVLNEYKNVIEKQNFPYSVREYLYHHNITFPGNDDRISSYVIGNNAVALNAAAETAKQNGFVPIILSSTIEGDVAELGDGFSKLALFTLAVVNGEYPSYSQQLCDLFSTFPSSQNFVSLVKKSKKICLLTGGEPTVEVRGDGIGGRNQELCLHFAKYCANCFMPNDGNLTFMSLGTDGQDGPTNAAGAIVDGNSWTEFTHSLLNPEDALQRNDSNTLMKEFNNGANLIQTGLTGTNVMDVHVLLIDT